MRIEDARYRMEELISSSALLSKRTPFGLSIVLLLTAMLVFLAYIARLNDVLHDVFHAMALAREFLATGIFPQADFCAFSPTLNPTVHHEWGFGLITYLVTSHSLGGVFLMLLRFLLISIMLLCSYRVCRARGGDPLLFAMGLILVLPIFWVGFSTLRAQQFTLTFIAMQMLLLEADWRNQKRWVAGWLLMLVLWQNIHAGFVVGAAMMGIHGFERCLAAWHSTRSIPKSFTATWHLCVAAPLAIAGLWLNPYGTEYLTYLAHALTMPRPHIGEWWPLWTIMNPLQTMLCFAVAVALALYCIRYRRWNRLAGMLFLILCAIMALKHVRHASIFALVWLTYVPAWLTYTPFGKRLRQGVIQNPRLTYRFASVVAIASVAFVLWFQGHQAYLPINGAGQRGNYPLGAVAFLEKHQLKGRYITDFDSGAYVTWRLYPNILVSLDGRYEAAFQPGVLEKHLEFFYAAPQSASILDEWKADGIIVPSGAPLADKLFSQTDSRNNVKISGCEREWKCVYRDPGTSIWVDASLTAPIEYTDQLPSNGPYPY